jgi:hypothetical protein
LSYAQELMEREQLIFKKETGASKQVSMEF